MQGLGQGFHPATHGPHAALYDEKQFHDIKERVLLT
jgi:hypothetical protein